MALITSFYYNILYNITRRGRGYLHDFYYLYIVNNTSYLYHYKIAITFWCFIVQIVCTYMAVYHKTIIINNILFYQSSRVVNFPSTPPPTPFVKLPRALIHKSWRSRILFVGLCLSRPRIFRGWWGGGGEGWQKKLHHESRVILFRCILYG